MIKCPKCGYEFDDEEEDEDFMKLYKDTLKDTLKIHFEAKP